MDANRFSRKERKERKGCGAFPKNFANLANFARAKKIRPHSTRFYTLYTAQNQSTLPCISCIPWLTITLHHQQQERNTYMKLEIDWLEMLKAVAKAIWPFIAGAFGGLFSGCTFGGIGPIFA